MALRSYPRVFWWQFRINFIVRSGATAAGVQGAEKSRRGAESREERWPTLSPGVRIGKHLELAVPITRRWSHSSLASESEIHLDVKRPPLRFDAAEQGVKCEYRRKSWANLCIADLYVRVDSEMGREWILRQVSEPRLRRSGRDATRNCVAVVRLNCDIANALFSVLEGCLETGFAANPVWPMRRSLPYRVAGSPLLPAKCG
jgi:hypothetical protein